MLSLIIFIVIELILIRLFVVAHKLNMLGGMVIFWFLMTLGGIIFSIHADACTFKEAKLLFRQLETKTNTYVVLHLDPRPNVEAYTSPWGIYVTQGMLDFTTKDELTMVLGHELTHYLYQDSRHHPSVAQELRADHYGYKMCKNLKYKKCKSFMLKMKKYFGEGGDDVHPIWSYRYKKLGG